MVGDRTRLLLLSFILNIAAPQNEQRSIKNSWRKNCSQPCSGPSCNRLTAKMEELLDLTVDPCQDFFRFACSPKNTWKTFSTNDPIVEFKQLVKNPPQGFEYIKKFYQSCTAISTGFTSEEVLMDCASDGVCNDEELELFGKIYIDFFRHMKDFTNKTAFPAVTQNWKNVTKDWFGGQGWNWWDFAANILKDNYFLGAFQYVNTTTDEYGDIENIWDIFRANLFFVPMIDTVATEENVDVGDLYPGIHIVPMRVSGFLRDGEDVSMIVKYKELMKRILGLLGSDPDSVERDVERILELELMLGRINSKDNFRSDDDWEWITITELYRLVPIVEWKDYIQSSFSSNEDFNGSKWVAIPSKNLMEEMGHWLKKIERRDQANLIIWRMLIMFANTFMHTGTEENDLQNDIFSAINPSAVTRADNCITQIRTFFPDVEDDMLIAKYINPDTKKFIKEMFKEIKKQFGNVIDESDWMGRRTKIRAREKLNATEIIIGELTPNTSEFQQLTEKMSQDYIENILAIGNYNWDTRAKSLLRHKELFERDEKKNNALYNPYSNKVFIKTGLINGVLGLGFSLDYPAAILYGGFVASTLGHELTHGFDSEGRKYDKDGFPLQWWEPEDDAAFRNKTSCLVSQYNNFSIKYDGKEYYPNKDYVFYEEDSAENIADNGGVKTAYRAFQEAVGREECLSQQPFSANQLFWLGYAMDWCTILSSPSYEASLEYPVSPAGHSPPPWRVNVPLSNLPEFSRDFQCISGDKLRPKTEEI